MRKINILGFIIFSVLLFTFLITPPLFAKTKLNWQAVSHVSKVELMHIQDDKKHLMGIYEHKGVALFADGQNAVFLDRGGFDMYVPQGIHFGYSRLTFKDGSIIDFKYKGEEYRKKGSELPFVKGKGTFTKGTGRFKGIKGVLSYDGGYLTEYDDKKGSYGDSVITYQATYTLEK